MHTAVNTHTVKSPDFFDKKRGVARLTSFAIIANSIESIPTRTNKRTVLCPVTAVFSCQVIMRLMLWVAAVWGRRVSRYLTPVLKTLYDNTKKVFWLKTKKCHTAAAIVWWANSVSSLSSRSADFLSQHGDWSAAQVTAQLCIAFLLWKEMICCNTFALPSLRIRAVTEPYQETLRLSLAEDGGGGGA